MYRYGLIVIAVLLLTTAGSALATTYAVEDLWPEGGHFFAQGINNQGTVVSCAPNFVCRPDSHAFISLEGRGQAAGVKNNGEAFGYCFRDDLWAACLWDKRGRLKALLPSLGGSFGYALASNGESIVGASSIVSGDWNLARPAIWLARGNHYQVIELAPSRDWQAGWAADVNAHGQIVGNFGLMKEPFAYVWQVNRGNGRVETLELGPGYAAAINDRGTVVGYTPSPSGGFLPVCWERDGMRLLPTLGGSAWPMGVNNAGVIVGMAQKPGEGLCAVAWHPDGTLVDLNQCLSQATDWSLFAAMDINEHGQIAACGSKGGVTHGLRLSPVCE